jgi:uncharacterized membrane protein
MTMTYGSLRAIFASLALTWAAALVAGTFIASRSETGTALYLVSAAVYQIGALVCHQRPERSFHVWGAQLPVCARCAGIYAGAALVAVAALSAPPDHEPFRLARDARRTLLFAALPTAVTLIAEWTTGQMPGNWIRAAAGFPLGATIAWVLVSTSAPRPAVEVH